MVERKTHHDFANDGKYLMVIFVVLFMALDVAGMWLGCGCGCG